MKISKSEYIKLVKQDLDWLDKQQNCLEKEHRKDIVKCSVCLFYDGVPVVHCNDCEHKKD